MPPGYVVVDARTVRGPDGREHDVLAAIRALRWTPQLCPLMRHQYTIWKKDVEADWPEWAWNVLSSMLLASNPTSFRAYFRGYPAANRYWDAPDGLRYWRGRREIDRGEPDGAGLRRVDEGAKPARDWDGPPHAPDGIGLTIRTSKADGGRPNPPLRVATSRVGGVSRRGSRPSRRPPRIHTEWHRSWRAPRTIRRPSSIVR